MKSRFIGLLVFFLVPIAFLNISCTNGDDSSSSGDTAQKVADHPGLTDGCKTSDPVTVKLTCGSRVYLTLSIDGGAFCEIKEDFAFTDSFILRSKTDIDRVTVILEDGPSAGEVIQPVITHGSLYTSIGVSSEVVSGSRIHVFVE